MQTEIADFQQFYLAELQELRSCESQLSETLIRLAKISSQPALRDAFILHRAQTESRKNRLDHILGRHHVDPAAHVDQAMENLSRETEK